MPRRARNTKRGSQVMLRKQQRERKLRDLFAEKEHSPALSLRALARHYSLPVKSVRERWGRYAAARAAGDDGAAEDALRDHRGGHNRALSAAEEAELSAYILAAPNAMTHSQIRDAALLTRARSDARNGRHYLRSGQRLFTASDGFVTAFKLRQRLSSHRTKIIRERIADGPPRDVEREAREFVAAVRDAIQRLGPHMVLNMDETPVSICEAANTGVTRTGSGQPAPIRTAYLNKVTVTTVTCTQSTIRMHACGKNFLGGIRMLPIGVGGDVPGS